MTRRFDLIATDIDNTLLNSRRTVSPRTLAALREAREDGAILMLASGRPEHGMRFVAEQHGIDLDGLVLSSCNGASVVDAVTDEVLTERYLDPEVVELVQRLAHDHGMASLTSVGRVLHTTDPVGYFIDQEPAANDMDLAVTKDFTTLDVHLHKVLINAHPEHLARERDRLVEALEGRAEASMSAPFYLQITPPGADKGTGLADYAAYRGIDLSRTIAFGDNENDIPLIRTAGTGVAMGNAVPGLKAAADHVTTSYDEDGIAEALKALW